MQKNLGGRYGADNNHLLREKGYMAVKGGGTSLLPESDGRLMTEKIKEQILAVRATGRTNMFDTNMVQVIADEMKFYELVVFIEEHKGDYAKFILTGEC